MYFNYQNKFTRPWLAKESQEKFEYEGIARGDNDLSLRIDLVDFQREGTPVFQNLSPGFLSHLTALSVP